MYADGAKAVFAGWASNASPDSGGRHGEPVEGRVRAVGRSDLAGLIRSGARVGAVGRGRAAFVVALVADVHAGAESERPVRRVMFEAGVSATPDDRFLVHVLVERGVQRLQRRYLFAQGGDLGQQVKKIGNVPGRVAWMVDAARAIHVNSGKPTSDPLLWGAHSHHRGGM